MESSNPTNPVRPTNAPDERNPTNAPDQDAAVNTPQTRGQNPDNAHDRAGQGDAVTTTPDDANVRGGYGGARQGDYDNRDGSRIAPEGGGQSDPAPSNRADRTGGTSGYTNADARSGSTAQGMGSRGGSYNDEQSNSPQSAEAGRQSRETGSAGSASGLLNTGPDQQRAAAEARNRPDNGPDSGGASTGRAPATDTSERV